MTILLTDGRSFNNTTPNTETTATYKTMQTARSAGLGGGESVGVGEYDSIAEAMSALPTRDATSWISINGDRIALRHDAEGNLRLEQIIRSDVYVDGRHHELTE